MKTYLARMTKLSRVIVLLLVGLLLSVSVMAAKTQTTQTESTAESTFDATSSMRKVRKCKHPSLSGRHKECKHDDKDDDDDDD